MIRWALAALTWHRKSGEAPTICFDVAPKKWRAWMVTGSGRMMGGQLSSRPRRSRRSDQSERRGLLLDDFGTACSEAVEAARRAVKRGKSQDARNYAVVAGITAEKSLLLGGRCPGGLCS
jgi:hypothetical protein